MQAGKLIASVSASNSVWLLQMHTRLIAYLRPMSQSPLGLKDLHAQPALPYAEAKSSMPPARPELPRKTSTAQNLLKIPFCTKGPAGVRLP